MTNNDEERRMMILTRNQFDEMGLVKDADTLIGYDDADFESLPLAPKHTDEEYEALEEISKQNYICAEKGKARIKELEAKYELLNSDHLRKKVPFHRKRRINEQKRSL